MNEQEMRDEEAPWPKTIEDLTDYINKVVDQPQDYGTCVYAMSLAATAAFHYAASKVGASGFQGECADMDVLRRTRGFEHAFLIRDLGNLLYPQYRDNFDTLAFDSLLAQNASWLKKEAQKMLAESTEFAAPAVIAHWQMILTLPDEEKDT